jgi:hypothetical protein
VRTPRSAIVGIISVAVLGLTAAGCGTSSNNSQGGITAPAASSPSPSPVDAKAALLASFTAVAKTSSSLSIKQGPAAGTAKVDPAGKKIQLSVTAHQEGITAKIDVIYISPNYWAKVDLGQLADTQLKINPKKWTKLDPAKLHADALPIDTKGGVDTDILDLPQLFTGLGTVKQDDAKHYSGTVDLTKATGDSAPTSDDLKGLGSKASAVPFTATVDDQGRLTNLSIQTGDPATEMEVTVSGYGAPQAINPPPASSVVTAPQGVYDILNG